MIRWLQPHVTRDMIRPLIYKVFTRGVLALFAAELFHFFAPGNWPMARFANLALILRRAADADPARAAMGRRLIWHAAYCRRLADMLLPAARGDMDAASGRLKDLIDWLSRVEDEIQPDFDLVLFHQEFSRKLK